MLGPPQVVILQIDICIYSAVVIQISLVGFPLPYSYGVRLSLGTAYFGIHGDFMGVKIEVIEGLSQKTH